MQPVKTGSYYSRLDPKSSVVGILRRREKAEDTESWQLPQWDGKDSPSEPLRKESTLLTYWFWTSGIQNREITPFCCSKPLSWWYSVTLAHWINTLCLKVSMPAGSAKELLWKHVWMCLNQVASLTDPSPSPGPHPSPLTIVWGTSGSHSSANFLL